MIQSPIQPIARISVMRTLNPMVILPYAILLIMIILMVILQHGQLSLSQFGNIPDTALPLVLVGLGETMVILTRGIDLSVGGIMALAATLTATIASTDRNFVPGLALILVIGVGLGAINGVLITALRIQPFIVTLATWSIADGCALLVLPTVGGSVAPSLLSTLGNSIGPIPKSLVIVLLLIAIWLFIRQTRFGVSIYALGSNENAAALNGLRVARTKIIVYASSGLCAALAGIYFAVLTTSGSPTAGDPYILQAVAAVVIGGTSLAGGRGGFVPTVLGAFILNLIGRVVFFANLTSFWATLGQGVLLIVTVLVYGIVDLLTRRSRVND